MKYRTVNRRLSKVHKITWEILVLWRVCWLGFPAKDYVYVLSFLCFSVLCLCDCELPSIVDNSKCLYILNLRVVTMVRTALKYNPFRVQMKLILNTFFSWSGKQTVLYLMDVFALLQHLYILFKLPKYLKFANICCLCIWPTMGNVFPPKTAGKGKGQNKYKCLKYTPLHLKGN